MERKHTIKKNQFKNYSMHFCINMYIRKDIMFIREKPSTGTRLERSQTNKTKIITEIVRQMFVSDVKTRIKSKVANEFFFPIWRSALPQQQQQK